MCVNAGFVADHRFIRYQPSPPRHLPAKAARLLTEGESSKAVHMALSLAYLKQLGLVSLEDIWIKLASKRRVI
ncbi:MAG: hypothetical protein KF851_01710 [Pirellulaceae bacterium]|nr:hypothetical protein [Pirellulaceae bacterium]